MSQHKILCRSFKLYLNFIRIFSNGFTARGECFWSGTAGSPLNSHTTCTTASSYGSSATGSRLYFHLYLFCTVRTHTLFAYHFTHRHISHTFLDAGAAEFLTHRVHNPHAALGPAPEAKPESGSAPETSSSSSSKAACSSDASPSAGPKPIVKRVLNYAALDPLHLSPAAFRASTARTHTSACTASISYEL